MMKDKLIVVYSTFPNIREAKRVLEEVVKGKLAACGNISNIDSGYMWDGNYQCEHEVALKLKTLYKKKELLINHINDAHPYDVPCILSWNTDVNKAYYEWVCEALDVEL